MEDKLPFENIKRKILTKKQVPTDENYGLEPNKRSMEQLLQYGVINLNKPQGPTSHLTTDYVKKILNVKKAGHGGTLD